MVSLWGKIRAKGVPSRNHAILGGEEPKGRALLANFSLKLLCLSHSDLPTAGLVPLTVETVQISCI